MQGNQRGFIKFQKYSDETEDDLFSFAEVSSNAVTLP